MKTGRSLKAAYKKKSIGLKIKSGKMILRKSKKSTIYKNLVLKMKKL